MTTPDLDLALVAGKASETDADAAGKGSRVTGACAEAVRVEDARAKERVSRN